MSNNLSKAAERLKQIGGVGAVLSSIALLGGVIIIIATLVSDNNIKIGLFAVGIFMYVICLLNILHCEWI